MTGAGPDQGAALQPWHGEKARKSVVWYIMVYYVNYDHFRLMKPPNTYPLTSSMRASDCWYDNRSTPDVKEVSIPGMGAAIFG